MSIQITKCVNNVLGFWETFKWKDEKEWKTIKDDGKMRKFVLLPPPHSFFSSFPSWGSNDIHGVIISCYVISCYSFFDMKCNRRICEEREDEKRRFYQLWTTLQIIAPPEYISCDTFFLGRKERNFFSFSSFLLKGLCNCGLGRLLPYPSPPLDIRPSHKLQAEVRKPKVQKDDIACHYGSSSYSAFDFISFCLFQVCNDTWMYTRKTSHPLDFFTKEEKNLFQWNRQIIDQLSPLYDECYLL